MSERTAADRRADLVALYKQLRDCTKCPLSEGRTQVVFGSGNADAGLMFVGEAPGFHEDQQGKPFVGRAGKLLDELLGGIEMTRDDVFVANVLKCRPPGNRDPQPSEIESCEPFLAQQVGLIEPAVICTLGNFATKLLTGRRDGIMKVHGQPQTHELGGRVVTIFPVYHPAAALRTPSMVDTLREDFARLPALLAASEDDAVEVLGGGSLEAPEGKSAAQAQDTDGQGEPSADQLGLFA